MTKFAVKWRVNPQNQTEILCGELDIGGDFYWSDDEAEAALACKVAAKTPDMLLLLQQINATQELPVALRDKMNSILADLPNLLELQPGDEYVDVN